MNLREKIVQYVAKVLNVPLNVPLDVPSIPLESPPSSIFNITRLDSKEFRSETIINYSPDHKLALSKDEIIWHTKKEIMSRILTEFLDQNVGRWEIKDWTQEKNLAPDQIKIQYDIWVS